MPDRPGQRALKDPSVTRATPDHRGRKVRLALAEKSGRSVLLDHQGPQAPQVKREKPVSRGRKGLLARAVKLDLLALPDR